MEIDQRSPRILDCGWGRIRVDGHGTMKDAKLYPGGARAWDWRETGTCHDPGIRPADVVELIDRGASVVVLSTGVFRRLAVCPETLRLLSNKGVPCHVLRTPDAVAPCARRRSVCSATRAFPVTCCARQTRSPSTTG